MQPRRPIDPKVFFPTIRDITCDIRIKTLPPCQNSLSKTKLYTSRKESLLKIFRLTCCLFVLLLCLVAFSFLSRAQASGGGGGGGNCVVSGVSVCSITVASTGKLTLARTAVLISATATCTVPPGFTFQFASASVQITQVSHQQVTQGFGGVSLTTCDGTAHPFQAAVTPFSAPFHGGPASATGSISVCYLDALGSQVCTSTVTSPQGISITG